MFINIFCKISHTSSDIFPINQPQIDRSLYSLFGDLGNTWPYGPCGHVRGTSCTKFYMYYKSKYSKVNDVSYGIRNGVLWEIGVSQSKILKL